MDDESLCMSTVGFYVTVRKSETIKFAGMLVGTSRNYIPFTETQKNKYHMFFLIYTLHL